MAAGFKIRDVSFAGSSVELSGGVTCTITDFMDDANPVEFQDCELTSVGVNCNGSMIRNAKPSAIMMSVTVIPGSDNDKTLYAAWKKYRIADKWQSDWENPISAKVSVSNGSLNKRQTSLSNGTFVSGPGGISANGEGKMQGRTYTFAFVTAD